MQDDAAASLDNRTASETFIALRYWSRVNEYEPTDAEKTLLTNCEVRANRQWAFGLLGGTTFGYSVAKFAFRMKQGVGITAVAAAGASLGSLAGQWLSNAPCLCELITLDGPVFGSAPRSDFDSGREAPAEQAASPLAEQARRILAIGGQQAVRELHEERMRGEFQAKIDTQYAQMTSHLPPTAEGGERLAEATSPTPVAPSSQKDSWAEVRRRYNERHAEAAGADESNAVGAHGHTAGGALDNRAQGAAGFGQPSRPPLRKNAYGDEMD